MNKLFKKKAGRFIALALILMPVISMSAGICAAESITIKGSTTVLPIAQSAAEVFMRKNPSVNISVQGGGSGAGIAALVDGTTDIADASRAIKDKEIKKAVSKGINPKAHVVAMDGIAVIVHPSNSLENLTKSQLKAIYTGKINNWSQIGGSGSQIVVLSRDSSSGTFETFNKLALDKAKVRADALLQASNKAVATTVARTPGAIGYVGLGYITSDVKPVKIESVMPSKQTVLSGEYILSRPLFMYTNGQPKGAAKDFINFVLSETGQRLAEESGYVGLK